MKQDVEILSLQGLFNPAPAHKNSHQDQPQQSPDHTLRGEQTIVMNYV